MALINRAMCVLYVVVVLFISGWWVTGLGWLSNSPVLVLRLRCDEAVLSDCVSCSSQQERGKRLFYQLCTRTIFFECVLLSNRTRKCLGH